MAVPKQKQSHSRTSKRRATHKISAPTINACPQCRQPRLPHRVCPHCGFYARSRGRARARPRSRPRPLGPAAMAAEQLTIALDANGADSGPAEVARGAALAAAGGELRVLVFGPAAQIEPAPGVEIVDAPVSIAKDRRPGARRARRPRVLDRPGGPRRRGRPRRRARVGRLDRRRARRGAVPSQARARRAPAGAGRARAGARGARSCCWTAAPTSRCGPSTSSSSRTWARRSWRP